MTPQALDALVAKAQSRLRSFINRSAAQQLRRMAEKWSAPVTEPGLLDKTDKSRKAP